MTTIQINGPYNFDLVLDRLSLDPLHVVDQKDRTVKVPLIIDHFPHVAEVKATGTTEIPSFVITGTNEEGISKISEIFQWHIDLQQIHLHFEKTTLKSLFKEHYGTALVLDFDLYNCLLKCIIHQQLNLAFAHTLTERFVKTYGYEQESVWFYPAPEQVAQLTVADLRELQFSGRKAEYVIGIAKKVVNGELHFDQIRMLSEQEISDKLIKLRGVGPWTIQNFLMFGLGRPNLFPFADIGIQNALKKQFELAEKPTKAEMEQFVQGWEPYLSYASLYLWRSIEKNGVKPNHAKRTNS
ncbi:DNA-3-methyladenine glycosylase 2 family protein [Bacillus sp. V3B]|uniref:DNA-3-methyladenine glycosylase family protein n=1 Tax=Bacillus sp. V3B TaxID=2804915 RepID=UPI00210B1794|nr:DNA-3-methyladenine glycosylase [Bacillus sp. V3B]MCQ6275212.1 DNA-3-methyladenine glycosylase 2 family protein [Bacillus sp. V3B]